MAGGDSAESMRGRKRLERNLTPVVRACHDQWVGDRIFHQQPICPCKNVLVFYRQVVQSRYKPLTRGQGRVKQKKKQKQADRNAPELASGVHTDFALTLPQRVSKACFVSPVLSTARTSTLASAAPSDGYPGSLHAAAFCSGELGELTETVLTGSNGVASALGFRTY